MTTDSLIKNIKNIWHQCYKALLIEHRLPYKVILLYRSIVRHAPIIRYKTYAFRNLRFRYRRSSQDLYTIREVLNENVYFKENFAISDSDTIIDIGAHIGSFAVYAASKARRGRVIAFEPMVDNYKLCQYNLKKNNAINVKLLDFGVASVESDKILHISFLSGSHSVMKGKKQMELTGKTRTIHCIDLNQVFDIYKITKCDFLKLDCEGAEYEILESLRPETWHKIKKIVLEYHEFPEQHLTGDRLSVLLKTRGFLVKLVPTKMIGIGYIYAKMPELYKNNQSDKK